MLSIGERDQIPRRDRRPRRQLGQDGRNSGLLCDRDRWCLARGYDTDIGQIHSTDKRRRKTRERPGTLSRFTDRSVAALSMADA